MRYHDYPLVIVRLNGVAVCINGDIYCLVDISDLQCFGRRIHKASLRLIFMRQAKISEFKV